MKELRILITLLRQHYQVPYPLAHFMPFANQKQLAVVREIQTEANLAADYCLVAEVSGRLVLTAPTDAYARRIKWDIESGLPSAWRPHDDPKSPIRVFPDVRFGRPSINGISTEALWEQVEDGADVNEVADNYGLTIREVLWAVTYETAARAA